MTETHVNPAVADTGSGRVHPHLLVGALAITQTVGYGVLFYAFSVLLTPIADDLRTSTASVTGALTTAIVVSAAAAIPIGRWLDRHGGRALMTAGSVLGVAGVIAWSQVQQVCQLYLVFAAIGLAGASTLYDAAFPVVIAATQPARRDRALLAITVVAGFASSIFFPLTGVLLAHLGWRTTLLVLAGLLAAVAVPAHVALVPGRLRRLHPDRVGPADAESANLVRQALRDRPFWLLATAFVAQAAAVSAVGVLLITYLRQAGHPATVAAFLSGLLGILSVTGRLVTTAAARRHGMTAVAAIVFAVQAVGVIALPHLGRSLAGAATCVVAFGLGFGVATIARPAIVADRYGTARYATIAATMTLPVTLAKAFAPLTAAMLAPNTFVTTAGITCLASAVMLWVTPSPIPSPQSLSTTYVRQPPNARKGIAMAEKPTVLFVCVHNAGRSQMAAGWLRHFAGDAVEVRSAGSEPAAQVNPAAVAAMAEVGIDIAANTPKLLDYNTAYESDVIITMGCGDACPVFPGKRYQDWTLDDPAGRSVDAVRPIRDDIRGRVERLVAELLPARKRQ